jgi:hypothetical protein
LNGARRQRRRKRETQWQSTDRSTETRKRGNLKSKRCGSRSPASGYVNPQRAGGKPSRSRPDHRLRLERANAGMPTEQREQRIKTAAEVLKHTRSSTRSTTAPIRWWS